MKDQNILIKSILLCLSIVVFHKNIIANTENSEHLSFSHQRGFYTQPFTMAVGTNLEGAVLYYTLDGSNPYISDESFVTSPPLSLVIDPDNTIDRDYAPGVVLRVCAVRNDSLIGEVVTHTYMFINKIKELSRDNVLPGPGWLEYNAGHDISYGLDPEIYNNPVYSNYIDDAFTSIPTISLVTDLGSLFSPDSGIYVNALFHGRDWERHASVELLNPDGSEGFHINCGLRIRGGWSRHYNNPKHAFRLIFRSIYGEGKLRFPLYGSEGTDEFDNIDLRTSQNYAWAFYGDSRNTFLREVFSRDTQRDMGQPHTRSNYYHLYINGTYWGLYQTQERSEASFAESYFGGTKEDYDVIKVDVGENFDIYNVEATDGSLTKWKELWDAGELGFSNDDLYYKVQGMNSDGSPNPNYERLLDVDNLIDYMIVTFFAGDFDGPISNFRGNTSPNNFYAIYNRVNPDGFKFFRHDGEHTLFDTEWGVDRTGPFPAGENFLDSNPQWIHQKLTENNNYRLRFADRVYKHFYNDGALTLDKIINRIQTRKAQIETAIIAESARWGDSKSEEPLTYVHWNNEVSYLLNTYLPTRGGIVLNQLKAKNLFYDTPIPQFNLHGGIVEKDYEVTLSSSAGEIYYTIDGTDPFSPFSSEESNFKREIVTQSALKRILIPTSAQNSNWYQDINFNDTNWFLVNGANGGIGYDDKGVYSPYLSFNTKQYMHESGSNPNTSCLIRIPFMVDGTDLSIADEMFLDINYDDGFVAYLNGNQILSVNAPSELNWNSASLTYLDSPGFTRFNISDHLSKLNSGQNLLAIHGLNVSAQSSDFLILPKLTIEKNAITGSASPSAKLYSSPIKIGETTVIKARVLVGQEWGVLSEAKFTINEDLSKLKITELHYHPLDEIVGIDTISGKLFEFLELKNTGDTDLNLTGSSFNNGITIEFNESTILSPGEFLIICSDSNSFTDRYGFSPDFQFNGNLDNGGERVTMVNPTGEIIFSFRYNDKSPWPEIADGDGYSLVSKNRTPAISPELVEYWTASSEIGGSPGTDDIVSNLNSFDNAIPNKFIMYQNYPNPFNPSTTVKFELPKSTKVSMNIYNILGELVDQVLNDKLNAGTHEVVIDSKDLSSGIYFYRINSEQFVETKKMIILK